MGVGFGGGVGKQMLFTMNNIWFRGKGSIFFARSFLRGFADLLLALKLDLFPLPVLFYKVQKPPGSCRLFNPSDNVLFHGRRMAPTANDRPVDRHPESTASAREARPHSINRLLFGLVVRRKSSINLVGRPTQRLLTTEKRFTDFLTPPSVAFM